MPIFKVQPEAKIELTIEAETEEEAVDIATEQLFVVISLGLESAGASDRLSVRGVDGDPRDDS